MPNIVISYNPKTEQGRINPACELPTSIAEQVVFNKVKEIAAFLNCEVTLEIKLEEE